jgi:hypothetical protein
MNLVNPIRSATNHRQTAVCIEFLDKPAMFLALLLSSMLALGCSTTKSNSNGDAQTPASQATSGQPAMSNVASPGSPQKPAGPPQKKRTQRPTMAKYSDETYGLSFRYPRKYLLKNGDEAASRQVPMNFVGGGVNQSLQLADCEQFLSPRPISGEQETFQPSQVAMGGMKFMELEDTSEVEGEQADTRYYHMFQNGACYEFALSLVTDRDKGHDGLSTLDRERVFRRLEAILASVKITGEVSQEATRSDASARGEDVK